MRKKEAAEAGIDLRAAKSAVENLSPKRQHRLSAILGRALRDKAGRDVHLSQVATISVSWEVVQSGGKKAPKQIATLHAGEEGNRRKPEGNPDERNPKGKK
jgi:hypothetical protein